MSQRPSLRAGKPTAPPILRLALLTAALLACVLAVHSASRVIDAIPQIKTARITADQYQNARNHAFEESPAAKEGWTQLAGLAGLAPALLPGPKATIVPPATQPTLPGQRAREFQTASQGITNVQSQVASIGPIRVMQAALLVAQLESLDQPRPWWPYIRPNLSGLDLANLKFELDATQQALTQAYAPLGLGPGGAGEVAEELIDGYTATFIEFLSPRLTRIALECAAAGDREGAETCRRLLFSMLRRMVVEESLPAVALVAGDYLARALASDLGKETPNREAIAAGLRDWRQAYHDQAHKAGSGVLSLNANMPSRAPRQDQAATSAIVWTLWLAVVTAALAVGAFLVTLLSIFSRIAAVLAKADDPGAARDVLKRALAVACIGVLLAAGIGWFRAPSPSTRVDDVRQLIRWKTAKTPPKAKGQDHWLPQYQMSFIEPGVTAAVVGVLAMRFGWLGRGVAKRAMAGTAASVCLAVIFCGIATAISSFVATGRIADYDRAVAEVFGSRTVGPPAASELLAPLRAWMP